MQRALRAFALLASFIVVSPSAVSISAYAQPAQQPTVDITKVPPAAQPSAHFDPDAATEAYMAMIPPAAKARSDAYFEGGYWLTLWNFLLSSIICLLLLQLRWSARMRDWAERVTRFLRLQACVYWLQYIAVTYLLEFPMDFYQGYLREHQYGLATQSFGPWLTDDLKSLLIAAVVGALAFTGLLSIVRRTQRSWWIWGSMATIVFLTIVVAVSPVFITPIFNHVKRLDDPKVTEPILRMAHANGIPAKDVYEIDASRQSTRISANVSGFAGTMRITLNDNLLKRGSPEEIQAVMGHEMGHYVMNHVYKLLFFFSVLIVLSFAYLYRGLAWALGRWGERWGIRSVSDPAVFPLVSLMTGVLFFALTPVMNSYVRVEEREADQFGLNVARQPDGFAQAAIHLSDYRKMRPGPIEEMLFYDHPSGYERIHASMIWKAGNLELFEPPVCPPPAH